MDDATAAERRTLLEDQRWEAEHKLKNAYKWSGSTLDDPTAISSKHGGRYDPLRPDEWRALIGKMLVSMRILDTPLNREMLDDFDSVHSLSGQLWFMGISYDPITPKFYVHGQHRRYEVKQHENGFLEAISSRGYDGTF